MRTPSPEDGISGDPWERNVGWGGVRHKEVAAEAGNLNIKR